VRRIDSMRRVGMDVGEGFWRFEIARKGFANGVAIGMPGDVVAKSSQEEPTKRATQNDGEHYLVSDESGG
jgi:hypothetical protein